MGRRRAESDLRRAVGFLNAEPSPSEWSGALRRRLSRRRRRMEGHFDPLESRSMMATKGHANLYQVARIMYENAATACKHQPASGIRSGAKGLSSLGTGVTEDILSSFGTGLQEPRAGTRAAVSAFGLSAPVVCAFDQKKPKKFWKSLAKSAQSGRRLAESAHSAYGVQQTQETGNAGNWGQALFSHAVGKKCLSPISRLTGDEVDAAGVEVHAQDVAFVG